MSEQGQVKLLEVLEIDANRGCLLDAGSEEPLLLIIDDLPYEEELWPQVGDHVYVVAGEDEHGNKIAYAAGEQDFEPLTFMAPESWRNQWLDAIVYNPLDMGTFVLCDGGVLGFGVMGLIHESERLRALRLGERIKVRVTFVREDGRVNCSMRQPKEISRSEDAERIFAYLKTCKDGAMPYSDETPADIIKNKFNISKGAFKRALGKLMKEGLVEQSGNWTQLKSKDDVD